MKASEIKQGDRFGRLTVLGRIDNRRLVCLCACGKAKIIRDINLPATKKGLGTQSCGCLHREVFRAIITTHGQVGSGAHRSWKAMKGRCLNPNNSAYHNYGGRGISICERWLKFENFFADMGDRPLGMTIERMNNDGNYEPDNCCWATRTEQNRNTRATG